jgi:hypothetical protein
MATLRLMGKRLPHNPELCGTGVWLNTRTTYLAPAA